MKIIFLSCLLIFGFVTKAQNTLFLEIEQQINTVLQQQKDIYFKDNLGNRKPLTKINAFKSGELFLLEQFDTINSSNKFSFNLLTIIKFKIEKQTIFFQNSKRETAATILGLKKADVGYLKKQFKKLQMLSIAHLEKKKNDEIKARKAMIKKRDDLPDSRIEKERIKVAKEAEKVFENDKSKN